MMSFPCHTTPSPPPLHMIFPIFISFLWCYDPWRIYFCSFLNWFSKNNIHVSALTTRVLWIWIMAVCNHIRLVSFLIGEDFHACTHWQFNKKAWILTDTTECNVVGVTVGELRFEMFTITITMGVTVRWFGLLQPFERQS